MKIETATLSDQDAAACAAFTADLPATLAGLDRVESEPADAPGAAYGDPAVVVTCGVGTPPGFSITTSSCETADGVGWYIPDAQYVDQGADLTGYAAGYRPRIEVAIPADYRPNAGPAVMAELAEGVNTHLRLVEACD